MRSPPSWPHLNVINSPKGPSLNPITLKVRASSTYTFGGDTIQSIAMCQQQVGHLSNIQSVNNSCYNYFLILWPIPFFMGSVPDSIMGRRCTTFSFYSRDVRGEGILFSKTLHLLKMWLCSSVFFPVILLCCPGSMVRWAVLVPWLGCPLSKHWLLLELGLWCSSCFLCSAMTSASSDS